MGFGSSKPVPRECDEWPVGIMDESVHQPRGRGTSLQLGEMDDSNFKYPPDSVQFLSGIDVAAFPPYSAPSISTMYADPTHQAFIDAKLEDARNLIRLARDTYNEHVVLSKSFQAGFDRYNKSKLMLNAADNDYFILPQRTTTLLYCCLNQLRHLKKDIENYIPAGEPLTTPQVLGAVQQIQTYAQALQLGIQQKLLVYARRTMLPKKVTSFCEANEALGGGGFTGPMIQRPKYRAFCSGRTQFSVRCTPPKGMICALDPKYAVAMAWWVPQLSTEVCATADEYNQRADELYAYSRGPLTCILRQSNPLTRFLSWLPPALPPPLPRRAAPFFLLLRSCLPL